MNKKFFFALPLFLYSPDGDAGSGGGAGATSTPTVTVTPAQANPASATPAIQPDTAATIANLTQERDAANARIRELNRENQKHRTSAETASATLEAERVDFEAYRKLGKPADLDAAIKERNTLKNEKVENAARTERDAHLSEVAKAARITALDAFKQLDRPGLVYEIKDDPKNKDAKEVFIKTQDASGKDILQPFDEFWKPFLSSIRPNTTPRPGAGPAPAPVQGGQQQAPTQRPRLGIF